MRNKNNVREMPTENASSIKKPSKMMAIFLSFAMIVTSFAMSLAPVFADSEDGTPSFLASGGMFFPSTPASESSGGNPTAGTIEVGQVAEFCFFCTGFSKESASATQFFQQDFVSSDPNIVSIGPVVPINTAGLGLPAGQDMGTLNLFARKAGTAVITEKSTGATYTLTVKETSDTNYTITESDGNYYYKGGSSLNWEVPGLFTVGDKSYVIDEEITTSQDTMNGKTGSVIKDYIPVDMLPVNALVAIRGCDNKVTTENPWGMTMYQPMYYVHATEDASVAKGVHQFDGDYYYADPSTGILQETGGQITVGEDKYYVVANTHGRLAVDETYNGIHYGSDGKAEAREKFTGFINDEGNDASSIRIPRGTTSYKLNFKYEGEDLSKFNFDSNNANVTIGDKSTSETEGVSTVDISIKNDASAVITEKSTGTAVYLKIVNETSEFKFENDSIDATLGRVKKLKYEGSYDNFKSSNSDVVSVGYNNDEEQTLYLYPKKAGAAVITEATSGEEVLVTVKDTEEYSVRMSNYGYYVLGNDKYKDSADNSVEAWNIPGKVSCDGKDYIVKNDVIELGTNNKGKLISSDLVYYNKEYYHTNDKAEVEKGVHKLGDNYYYADPNTGVLKEEGGVITYNDDNYYVISNMHGLLAQNEEINNVYYGADGKAVKDTGDQKPDIPTISETYKIEKLSDGHYYFVNSVGTKKTDVEGLVNYKGDRYWIKDGLFTKGALANDEILTSSTNESVKYSFDQDCKMQINVFKASDSNYYYADPDTGMITTGEMFITCGGNYYYRQDDGTLLTNAFATVNGIYRHFGNTGKMDTTSFEDKDLIYYPNSSTGEIKEANCSNGPKYPVIPDDQYEIKMSLDGNRYFFDTDGNKKTDVSGMVYYNGSKYWMKNIEGIKGALASGEIVTDPDDPTAKYAFDINSNVQLGVFKAINSNYYYGDEKTGKIAIDEAFFQWNGDYYCRQSGGILLTSSLKSYGSDGVGGTNYRYFGDDAKMKTGYFAVNGRYYFANYYSSDDKIGYLSTFKKYADASDATQKRLRYSATTTYKIAGTLTSGKAFSGAVKVLRVIPNSAADEYIVFSGNSGVYPTAYSGMNTAAGTNFTGYTGERMNNGTRDLLSKVTYLGFWTTASRTCKDYAFTQMYVWETLPLAAGSANANIHFTDATTANAYNNWKDELNSKLDKFTDKPSFDASNGKSISIKPGETLSLVDTNNALSDYDSGDTTITQKGVTIKHISGSNTLTVTAAATAEPTVSGEPLVFTGSSSNNGIKHPRSGPKRKDGTLAYGGNYLYWNSVASYPDILISGVTSTLPFTFNVDVQSFEAGDNALISLIANNKDGNKIEPFLKDSKTLVIQKGDKFTPLYYQKAKIKETEKDVSNQTTVASSTVPVSGGIANVSGTFKITYQVPNSAGNRITYLNATIIVNDPPEIVAPERFIFKGADPLTALSKIKISDKEDGAVIPLEKKIVSVNGDTSVKEVDTSKVGKYTVRVKVKDSLRGEAEKDFIVNVIKDVQSIDSKEHPRFIDKETINTLNDKSIWISNNEYYTELVSTLNNETPIDSYDLNMD